MLKFIDGYLDEPAIFEEEMNTTDVSQAYGAGNTDDLSLNNKASAGALWFRMGDVDGYPTIGDLFLDNDGTMVNMTSADIVTVVP